MIELCALAWLYQDDALMTDLVVHDIHRGRPRGSTASPLKRQEPARQRQSGQFRRDLRHHGGGLEAECLCRLRHRSKHGTGAERPRSVRQRLSPRLGRARTFRQGLPPTRLHRDPDLRAAGPARVAVERKTDQPPVLQHFGPGQLRRRSPARYGADRHPPGRVAISTAVSSPQCTTS